MMGASIASSIASIKMTTDTSVLFAVNATIDGVRAGLTPGQIFERYCYGLAIGVGVSLGVMFAPGIIAGIIRFTPAKVTQFIANRYTGLWDLIGRFSNAVIRGPVVGSGGQKIVYALRVCLNIKVLKIQVFCNLSRS